MLIPGPVIILTIFTKGITLSVAMVARRLWVKTQLLIKKTKWLLPFPYFLSTFLFPSADCPEHLWFLQAYDVLASGLLPSPFLSTRPFLPSFISWFLNVSLSRLISEAIFKKRPACIFGSLLRQHTSRGLRSRRPFLTLLLDRVLEAKPQLLSWCLGNSGQAFCWGQKLSALVLRSARNWLKPPGKCWRELKGRAVPFSCHWLSQFLTTQALCSGHVPKGSGGKLWCWVSSWWPHSRLPPNPVVLNRKLFSVLMNCQMVCVVLLTMAVFAEPGTASAGTTELTSQQC